MYKKRLAFCALRGAFQSCVPAGKAYTIIGDLHILLYSKTRQCQGNIKIAALCRGSADKFMGEWVFLESLGLWLALLCSAEILGVADPERGCSTFLYKEIAYHPEPKLGKGDVLHIHIQEIAGVEYHNAITTTKKINKGGIRTL